MVCDEPTSALDVSVQAQILNLMRDLQDRLGLSYLFISHNLAVVRHMATRIGVMYLGRIVEMAPADELFESPRHPYTRMLIDALPDLAMTGRARRPIEGEIPNPIAPPPGCAFHPRCPHAYEPCRVEVPALVARAGVRRVPCGGGGADSGPRWCKRAGEAVKARNPTDGTGGSVRTKKALTELCAVAQSTLPCH